MGKGVGRSGEGFEVLELNLANKANLVSSAQASHILKYNTLQKYQMRRFLV
jgi:hypothetical protein